MTFHTILYCFHLILSNYSLKKVQRGCRVVELRNVIDWINRDESGCEHFQRGAKKGCKRGAITFKGARQNKLRALRARASEVPLF